ncbi:hypothetical protein HYC85_030838 [Camellia sinensis]|uniref:Poor homologous synapsis 1 PH domain-containing protein n=1 Tax=Camellia sinensis TaxID=4442 RepID=A0A7J7G2D7_CAMSI|nr:hypothetical protein HYC85_030838 [Camellia sinensis]
MKARFAPQSLIQKFAIRFSNSYESQTFINYVKECFKDARNIELPCCNLRSEVSSQTENSNDVQDRANQELDFVNLIDNYSPLMQSPLNYHSEQYAYPEETTLPNDLGDTCEALPSSFTDLLSDCCTEVEQEPPTETTLPNDLGDTCEALPPSFTDLLADCCTEVEQEPPTETTLPNDLGDTCEALPPSFTDLLADCFTEVEQEPPTELEEVDLKSQIARYMTTTSFHDMLSKLEKGITDMGGDLAS